MLSEGDAAPDFELPGTDGEDIRTYALRDFATEGGVVLSFYAFDFAPSCTREVCGLRDTQWFQFVENLDVLAVSPDGPFSHIEFIDTYDLDFPLLCDPGGAVAEIYGTIREDWLGFSWITQRSTFLIDEEMTVRHVTTTEDPLADPPLDPVREAARELEGTVG